MPGNYKRTSTRKSWSQEDMDKAIEAVKNNRMGWLLASKHFNVPQATLRRHYHSTPVNLGRFKPTFNKDMEKALVDRVLEFESRLFGFNTTEIRKLAFEFAEKLGLNHRFDKNEKIAGWDWLKGFRERNPNIALRAPEPTSAARARAFNKSQVSKFFALLEREVTANEIQPHRIFNMDESGLNTVQKPPKVFASKGKKQVGAVTSAERGEHFTVVACANAIGNFVPPALIIPRKNHKAEYFDGAPSGTLELCYPSGYMVGDLFFKWMRHFIGFVNASVTNKALLILDGHSSHKNIEALELAKSNGVIMLCLPPHCTHRMQPTDVSFFGPLQAYYDREMATWMKNHPGRTVGLYQVAQIFGRAYENAASVKNITSGFGKTGIFPFNPNIFPEEMYLPSEVTENELNNDEEPVASTSSQPELNNEDSSESTDAEEQIMENAADNSQEQIDFQATSRDVEGRPSSPSILLPNTVTHLSQHHNDNTEFQSQPILQESDSKQPHNAGDKINIIISPSEDATSTLNNPLSLQTLAANMVEQLLKDHDKNIPFQSLHTLLEPNSEKSTNAKEETRLLQTGILSATNCILNDISPLPKATGRLKAKRKVGGAQVFTSSPFMNDIKSTIQQKKEKENLKSLKQQKKVKRVIFEDDDVNYKPASKKLRSKRGPKRTKPDLDDDENLEKIPNMDPGPSSKKYRSTRSRKQTQPVILNDDDVLDDPYAHKDAEEEEDPACIYCNEMFSQSRPKEHWVKCQLCSNWCHTLCAGIPARKKHFVCELCS
ncbi:uncharacterized protein LOC132901895 [Amyelois transitella]|uniref:uncharacterized protein LOC132901895 n=1 Tax=Amyelois transitella TaxID=680683 RepID=UPI00298F4CC6|nr:uncharacterized protein LOC132901895 [Amyelois transitella]